MAYEFKTLGTVELLDSMPENAKVLVEVDGATKRVPQAKPVDEIALIVGSEALEEVPEGATVLAEVNGEIKRVPGEELGGKGMVVNFTMDMGTQVITADKTYEEVKLALQEGRNVIGSLSASDENFSMSYTLNAEYLKTSFQGSGEEVIAFYSVIGGSSDSIIILGLAPDNTVTQDNILEGPSTTSSVSSGSSALVTSGGVYTYVEGKGYQTQAQVTTLINNALGVIENGTY